MADHAHDDSHSEAHYLKVYALLLVLLLISILGPELEIQVVTLVTAFGIAFWKAWLVIKNFMHVPAQPRFVSYLLTTALVFMLLLFAGSAPDVMKWDGHNWHKPGNTRPATDRNGHELASEASAGAHH